MCCVMASRPSGHVCRALTANAAGRIAGGYGIGAEPGGYRACLASPEIEVNSPEYHLAKSRRTQRYGMSLTFASWNLLAKLVRSVDGLRRVSVHRCPMLRCCSNPELPDSPSVSAPVHGEFLIL